MTRQREAVWHALAHSGRPMSPGEILAVAQQSVSTMVLSTVYRNIRALVGDGRVEAIVLPGQPDRYAAVANAGKASGVLPADVSHRHYFQCRQCDRVFPLEGCPGHLDEITPPGFEVDSHEITLLGRCAECAAGSSTGAAAAAGAAGDAGGPTRKGRAPHRH